MTSVEPFTFGIALIPRRMARDWRHVEALLDLTLESVRAQTAQDFRVVIACHDRPRLAPDPRITVIEADWPVEDPGFHNRDSARKHEAISEHVSAHGGGLLMFLDADDWVDVCTVETARRLIGPECVGALMDFGLALDFRTLRCAALPHPRIFAREFHRICGSGGVIRLRPDAADPFRRNPKPRLGPHNCWVEHAQAHGGQLTRLPLLGSYLINNAENHSEIHGPYASWREEMIEAVNREGGPLSRGLAARFGLARGRIRAAGESLSPPMSACRAPDGAPHAAARRQR